MLISRNYFNNVTARKILVKNSEWKWGTITTAHSFNNPSVETISHNLSTFIGFLCMYSIELSFERKLNRQLCFAPLWKHFDPCLGHVGTIDGSLALTVNIQTAHTFPVCSYVPVIEQGCFMYTWNIPINLISLEMGNI